MKFRHLIRKSIIKIFILVLIILYFLFLIDSYIIPNHFKISFILLFGFAIILIGIFYFFLKINSPNSIIVRVKILDENSIKAILMILMAISIFIPPVSFSNVIIAWNQINILNYIRGFIFLIGSLIIPGSCIFNLILGRSSIHERLNVEAFLVKITIYPIISLIFLGSLTLLLDFLGFTSFSILLFLFFSFIFLFLLNNFRQKNNRIRNILYIKTSKISVSKYTFLILIIGLGIIVIASSFILSKPYLLAGDRWRGIYAAPLIGLSDPGPFEKLLINGKSQYYTYWGYIVFSLSKLCGIPYINTNVLLYPLLYISITSIYLFMKAILNRLNEIFSVLSAIFVVLLFNPTMLMIEFTFHSFAFLSLFLSLTLFFIVIKSDNLNNKAKINTENKILLIFSSLFLIQSLISYFLPALIGILLILLFSLFSTNIKHYLRYIMFFYFSIAIIFISFDLLCFNFFSYKFLNFIMEFLGINQTISFLYQRFLYSFLFYIFLISAGISLVLINDSSNHLSIIIKKMKKKVDNIISKKSFINYFFVFIFVFFSLCLLLANLDSTFIDRLILRGKGELNPQEPFLIFYLGTLFGYIGLIGIFGIYLSFFCFKENKKIFIFLFSWIVLTIGLASFLIFLRWMQYPTSLVSDIPEDYSSKLIYWFTRNWYYSIIPFSIFASIGLIKLIQNVKSPSSFSRKSHGWFKLKTYIKIKSIAFIPILLLVFFSLSSPITQLQYWDNYFSVSDEHAQIIGWTTENVPIDSKILICPNDYHLTRIERDLFLYQTYYLYEEMMYMNNVSELISHISSEKIYYFIIYVQYVNENQELLDNFYSIKLYQYGNLIIYQSIEI